MDNVKIMENGVETTVSVLAYLSINGKKYLFYSLNDFTDDGLPKIRITACNNQDNQISDEEWTNIKSVISQNANKIDTPNVEYLKTESTPYNIGTIKKLAVKPELKQAFCDYVNNKLIGNQTQEVISQPTGPVNEQMPYYDQNINTSGIDANVMNQAGTLNAFDNSITPPVQVPEVPAAEANIPNAAPVENPFEAAPIENPLEATPAQAPIENTLEVAPVENNVEPIQTAPIEEKIAPISEPTTVDSNVNVQNDMIEKFKEIISQNMQTIENSIKNIKSAMEVLNGNNSGEVLTNEKPKTENVPSEPVEENIVEAPVGPTNTFINDSINLQAPSELEGPILNQNVIDSTQNDIMNNSKIASPVEEPAYIPSSDAFIPENLAPSAVPEMNYQQPSNSTIDAAFMGMSPGTMPVNQEES